MTTKACYVMVGMKHIPGATELVASLPKGEPMRLVREPGNAFDPLAVQVWARDQRVGYVAGKQNRALAAFMDHVGTDLLGKLAIGADRYPMIEIDE